MLFSRTIMSPAPSAWFTGLLAGAAVVSVLGQSPAMAQPAGGRIVVPAVEQVAMRCEAGTAWYTIANLGSTAALQATGTFSDGYLEVDYPAGTPVVVKNAEVEVQEGVARLIRRSRLRAFSFANPVMEECFKAVFDEFLEPGIPLRIIKPIANLAGQQAGWLVEAPAGARGWILQADLRDATPDEVAHFNTLSGGLSLTQNTPDTQITTPDASPVTIDQQPVETAIPVLTAALPERAPSESLELEELAPLVELPPVSPTLKVLDAAFDRMRRQPLQTSDESELIEQYLALEQELIKQGSTERTIDYINQRIEVLKLRQEFRETSNTIDRLGQSIQGVDISYTQSIDRLAKSREYLLVGRLLPSSVYDGERLPLLYRLTSIDSAVPRTLAYITPEPDLKLDSKTGAIVGVMAGAAIESTAEIGIIKPTVVDVLSAGQSVTAEANESEN